MSAAQEPIDSPSGPVLARLTPWVGAVALVRLLVHLLTAGRYGVFRDELYYLACADHLDWGYVDHPPLSIALLWVQRVLFGDSALALRVLPALAGAALVLLAGLLAREMGGGRFAQALAAVAVGIAPQYLVIHGFYSMNAFDLLFWAAGAWLVARILRTGQERLWLAFGLVAGLALENKLSFLFFAAGLAAAVPFTPLSRHLKSRFLWLGAGLSSILFLPHLLWQAAHGWPTREFIANAAAGKIVRLAPHEYFLAQIGEIHPFNLPLWLLGLGWLLFARAGRPFRALGIVYLAAFAILAAGVSKPYYLGPAYPMLLAAGACGFGALTHRRRWRWARAAALALLVIGGALVAPFVVPVLPVESFVSYQEALGATPSSDERHALGPLPQHYADRFGWQEMTEAVARAWASLPPEERARALIVAGNYGEAGAIGYYGRQLGLPQARSQHNSYFLWGPGEGSAEVAILVGMDPESPGLRATFESVEVAGRFTAPYAMPYETARPILVARGLKLPLEEAWERGKHYE